MGCDQREALFVFVSMWLIGICSFITRSWSNWTFLFDKIQLKQFEAGLYKIGDVVVVILQSQEEIAELVEITINIEIKGVRSHFLISMKT